MEKLVDRMMQDDFAKYANQDLNRPVTEGVTLLQEVGSALLPFCSV